MDNKNMIEELYKLIQDQVNKDGRQITIDSALEMITSALKENELSSEIKGQSDSLKNQLQSIIPENIADMESLKDKAAEFMKGNSLNLDTLQGLVSGVLDNDALKNQLGQLSSGKEIDAKSLINGLSSLVQSNGGTGAVIPMNLLNLVQGIDIMKLIEGVSARRKNKSIKQENKQEDNKSKSKQKSKNSNPQYKIDYEYDECDLWY
ncbi:hypothetical protein HP456_01015 [Bacillus haikouensis]|jgi:hypothetical protein|uniref:hypothetical protein n=1 Tax=Bacillus haikouensis TaxID=1510468 RepID=UPI00155468CB|nr:hypothetical protein [Bacillus haikouensis]NQD64502.1 hypothetical protein [Bacillus haikouensis]